MAKGNSSKSQEHFDITDNDRISKLPDPILSHILSFLPTKYSVQTSILSRRWRFTWTSVAVLDLYDGSFEPYHLPKRRRISACKKSFKNFVNMVLILRSHPCLQRFRLHLANSYPTSDVNSWIWAAITHNIQELELSMRETFKLPRGIFNCGTLVVLKLEYEIDLDVPETVSLPSLKNVQFQSLQSLCDASIERILSGSPILEELVIDQYYKDDVKIYSILSSSLKTLIIRRRNSGGYDNHYEVFIDAPKLQYLELYDGTSQAKLDSIEFKNAPSILKSTFLFPDLSCNHVPTLGKTTSMYGIRNVKVLSAPLFMLKTPLSYPRNIRFNNLTQLVVKYCGKDLSNSRLPQILRKLPNLEVLILTKPRSCYHTITCEDWEQEKSDDIICLKWSLKKLQLDQFDAKEGGMQMLEYFLENARVLNEIRLITCRPPTYGYRPPTELAFLNKLLTNPRCSNALKIIIS